MHVYTTVFYLAIKHIDAANTSTSNHFGTISLHFFFNVYDLMKEVTFRSYILNNKLCTLHPRTANLFASMVFFERLNMGAEYAQLSSLEMCVFV